MNNGDPNAFWANPENVEKLRQLWADGLFAAPAAEEPTERAPELLAAD